MGTWMRFVCDDGFKPIYSVAPESEKRGCSEPPMPGVKQFGGVRAADGQMVKRSPRYTSRTPWWPITSSGVPSISTVPSWMI